MRIGNREKFGEIARDFDEDLRRLSPTDGLGDDKLEDD
jgi:hypothetical protein